MRWGKSGCTSSAGPRRRASASEGTSTNTTQCGLPTVTAVTRSRSPATSSGSSTTSRSGPATGIAALSKERDYRSPNTVRRATLLGAVADKNVLIIDAIVGTASTLAAAVHALWDEGARSVVAAGVHTLLSGEGRARVDALQAEASRRGVRFQLIGTSSVDHADPPADYRSFDLAPLLASVIRRVNTRGSVSAAVEEL